VSISTRTTESRFRPWLTSVSLDWTSVHIRVTWGRFQVGTKLQFLYLHYSHSRAGSTHRALLLQKVAPDQAGHGLAVAGRVDESVLLRADVEVGLAPGRQAAGAQRDCGPAQLRRRAVHDPHRRLALHQARFCHTNAQCFHPSTILNYIKILLQNFCNKNTTFMKYLYCDAKNVEYLDYRYFLRFTLTSQFPLLSAKDRWIERDWNQLFCHKKFATLSFLFKLGPYLMQHFPPRRLALDCAIFGRQRCHCSGQNNLRPVR